MNEERRKRGFAYSKTLMTAAICALFLSGGSVMAHAAAAPVAQEQQQTTNVTVTVVDSKGEPIIGANVVEKGTTNGTITDVSGKAALNVKKGATLQVSFVGFKTQEVKAQGSLRVVLRDDNELLDEVVVVGYGTQKKANLTGAVSTVDVSKTMEGRPQTDVMKALQGAVPGLTITNNSGDINGSASIEIRGVGSINGTLKPLYIVDGVSMSDISFLNPEDIEVIDDGSSDYPWEHSPIKLNLRGWRAPYSYAPYPQKTLEPYVENGYAYISEEMPLTLIPYGCTPLRISCFPRADLRKKET